MGCWRSYFNSQKMQIVLAFFRKKREKPRENLTFVEKFINSIRKTTKNANYQIRNQTSSTNCHQNATKSDRETKIQRFVEAIFETCFREKNCRCRKTVSGSSKIHRFARKTKQHPQKQRRPKKIEVCEDDCECPNPKKNGSEEKNRKK